MGQTSSSHVETVDHTGKIREMKSFEFYALCRVFQLQCRIAENHKEKWSTCTESNRSCSPGIRPGCGKHKNPNMKVNRELSDMLIDT